MSYDQHELTEGPLEEAYREFAAAQETYRNLLSEHPDIMAQWFLAINDLNNANERIRVYLREAAYDSIGDFRRSITQKREVDVDLLIQNFPQAEHLEGLYTTKRVINKDVLEGYLLDGSIPQTAVDDSTISNKPRITIRGPVVVKGVDKL